MFNKYDTDHDGFLDVQEMGLMLKDIDKNMTNLPAVSVHTYIYLYIDNICFFIYISLRLHKLQVSRGNTWQSI